MVNKVNRTHWVPVVGTVGPFTDLCVLYLEVSLLW